MKEIGVITNPTSGSGRGARLGAETLAALAARGYRLRDLSGGSWGASYEVAARLRRSLDALVVVGGDGMVHLGLQVCAEHSLPLGIVAAGSGNDVAIELGLPIHDIPAAVDRIDDGLRGDVTRIDVGRLTGVGVEHPNRPRYFLAVLSAGIDAAVAAYGQNLKYPRGPLKYKVATLRELPRFKPYGVTTTVDGMVASQTCTLVAVANSRVFGGGLIISPGSSVIDGKLELVLADAMSRRDILRVFPKLYDGSVADDERIRYVSCEEVTITQGEIGARMPAAFADGELVGAAPLRISVAPRALRVLGARPQ